MFGRLGPWEIGLILAIILIIFGVGKLPQVSSSIGKGLRSFRKAASGEDEEDEESVSRIGKKRTKGLNRQTTI